MWQKKHRMVAVLVASVGVLPYLFNGCNGVGTTSNSAGTANLNSQGSLNTASADLGVMTVPTADAVIARLQNGLEKNVSPGKGNFAKALPTLKANLPQVTNPTSANGFDQIELLAYGACSDLTTGSTPLMKSVYNVDPKATIAASQNALVAAGVRMMDQYTAGLASGGPTAQQVSVVFTNLVNQIIADTTDTNTSTIAFMSVCMAANTAGASLMGF